MPLPAATESRAYDLVRRRVEVGVGHHQHVFWPAGGLRAFAVSRRGFVNVFRDLRRADEADRGDVGMFEQRVNRLRAAVDDVEDAFGSPASVISSASRIGVRGTFGEGLRMNALPQTMAMETSRQDHCREIERRDSGADSERMSFDAPVNAARDVVERLP